ncbi:hypothetical protein D0817_25725, partial [Flavobacterium cupreum]
RPKAMASQRASVFAVPLCSMSRVQPGPRRFLRPGPAWGLFVRWFRSGGASIDGVGRHKKIFIFGGWGKTRHMQSDFTP